MTLNKLSKAFAENKHENLTTKEVLTDLFKENTGRHMLDSGGAYGRNFEENNKKGDLEEEKEELTIDLRDVSGSSYADGDVECIHTVSAFHFLLRNVDFTEKAAELTHDFKQFEERDDSNDSWLSLMERYVSSEDKEAHAVNTYNHEFNNLDQVLQFVPFTLQGGHPHYDMYGEFVLLQVHGGCDVRGGYTAPIVLNMGMDGGAALTRGAPCLDISASTGQRINLMEHETTDLELEEMDLRAVPRDLSDDVDGSDDVDFIVDLEGNEVEFHSGGFVYDGGRSVNPEDFKDEVAPTPP